MKCLEASTCTDVHMGRQLSAQSPFQTGRPDLRLVGIDLVWSSLTSQRDKTVVKTNRGNEGPQGAECLVSRGWRSCLRQEVAQSQGVGCSGIRATELR